MRQKNYENNLKGFAFAALAIILILIITKLTI
jgi:hypothetical protein